MTTIRELFKTSRGPVHYLATANAVRRSLHVVYASGRHGDSYVNKDRLFTHTSMLTQMVRDMTSLMVRNHPEWFSTPFHTVVGPAAGGMLIAQVLVGYLGECAVACRPPTSLTVRYDMTHVRMAYAEKVEQGAFRIRESFHEEIRGKRVLVTEDVMTTGSTVRKVIAEVENLGGEVVGVATLVKRGVVTAETLGIPALYSLIELHLPSYEPEDCPLCKAGVPFTTDVGHATKHKAPPEQA